MESWAEGHESWYEDRFPAAHLAGPVVLNDDLDANELQIVMPIGLPRDGFDQKGLWRLRWYFGYNVASELRALEKDEVLTGATSMGQPRSYVHRVIVEQAPAPLAPPVGKLLETDFIRFEWSGAYDDAQARWSHEWRLDVQNPILKPGDEQAWRTGETIVDDNDHYKIDLHFNLMDVVLYRPVIANLRPVDVAAFGVGPLVLLLLIGAGWRGYVVPARDGA